MVQVINILFVFILIFFNSCQYLSNSERIEVTHIENPGMSIEFHPVISFIDKDSLQGRLESACFIDPESFAIITSEPIRLVSFTIKGSKLFDISVEECMSNVLARNAIIRSHQNLIYVWCNSSFNIKIFDIHGNHIGLINGFEDWFINDFVIYNNFICFYHKGEQDFIVSIWDLSKNRYVFKSIGGTNENMVLEENPDAGKMTIVDNLLYFVSSDNLNIHCINLENFKYTRIDFKDKEFSVDKIKNNNPDAYKKDYKLFMDYILKNSYVNGLYNIGEVLVLRSEIGIIRQKGLSGALDFSKRFTRYYCIYPDGTFDSVSFKGSSLNNYPFLRLDNDPYYINAIRKSDGKRYYTLTKLKILINK